MKYSMMMSNQNGNNSDQGILSPKDTESTTNRELSFGDPDDYERFSVIEENDNYVKFKIDCFKDNANHQRCGRTYHRPTFQVNMMRVVDTSRGEGRGYTLNIQAQRGIELGPEFKKLIIDGYHVGFTLDVEYCARRNFGETGRFEAELTVWQRRLG